MNGIEPVILVAGIAVVVVTVIVLITILYFQAERSEGQPRGWGLLPIEVREDPSHALHPPLSHQVCH